MAELCPPLYDRPRLETYRMCKYIVDVTTNEIPPPEYLRNTRHINFRMILQSNQEAIKFYQENKKVDIDKSKVQPLESFEINPLELSNWPTANDLGMDMPQYVAFQSAITHELAIIQGPPGSNRRIYYRIIYILNVRSLRFSSGTGKTYIGLQIMKLLLANDLGNSDSPILVVCYTSKTKFCVEINF